MSDQQTETYQCPYCRLFVTINVDEQGMVHASREYTLIADWVYHSDCWDAQIREFPP